MTTDIRTVGSIRFARGYKRRAVLPDKLVRFVRGRIRFVVEKNWSAARKLMSQPQWNGRRS
jgi:hypothetical protein